MKHLYLVLGSTFLFGVIAGVLLFLGTLGREGGGSIDDAGSGYVIEAYAYGGCMRQSCPLYRIMQTGEYTYVGAEGERRKGTLPLNERRLIGDVLKDAELSVVSETSFLGECPINYDGVAYRYDITYKNEQYRIDTCAQETNGVLLFETLSAYFDRFSDI
jgi:hypothetical protein